VEKRFVFLLFSVVAIQIQAAVRCC